MAQALATLDGTHYAQALTLTQLASPSDRQPPTLTHITPSLFSFDRLQVRLTRRIRSRRATPSPPRSRPRQAERPFFRTATLATRPGTRASAPSSTRRANNLKKCRVVRVGVYGHREGRVEGGGRGRNISGCARTLHTMCWDDKCWDFFVRCGVCGRLFLAG